MNDNFFNFGRIKFLIFLSIIALNYAIINIYLFLWFVNNFNYSSFLFLILTEFLLIGFSYSISETIYSLLDKPKYVKSVDCLHEYPSVALVMTICDDLCEKALSRLGKQDYKNLDIYILDDSKCIDIKNKIDTLGFTYVKRNTNAGFKAGNLNNWLEKYGIKYKYLVVFDSDSLADNDFVSQMVKYAECPDNDKISMFQSKIISWNKSNIFSQVVSIHRLARFEILSRTSNNFGTVFSEGHNYLLRVNHLIEIDGYLESITPEDTAITLQLSQKNYYVSLVNIISYDKEPSDMYLHSRRQMRWAKQTVETFRLPWKGVSLRLKIYMCLYLYQYFVNLVYFLYLGIFVWVYHRNVINDINVFRSIYHSNSNLIVNYISIIWIFHITYRAILSYNSGGKIVYIFANFWLRTPLIFSFVFQQFIEIKSVIMGENVTFSPTNSITPRDFNFSIFTISSYMKYSLIFIIILIFGLIFRNQSLLLSANIFIVVLITFSPFILWIFHLDQVDR